MAARGRSGHSERAMLQTAWATTETATSFSPCSRPAPTGDSDSVPAQAANITISAADGRVKPAQAASPPHGPARSSPSAKPAWLDAGPGRNWHSPTSSA